MLHSRTAVDGLLDGAVECPALEKLEGWAPVGAGAQHDGGMTEPVSACARF